MPVEIFLGMRYLKAKRKQAFISIISIISVVGVMVGVMALIVVISVMNGFRADLMSKILGVNAHILVLNYHGPFRDYIKVLDDITVIDGVTGATPFIYSQVMINSDGRSSGAILRGLDPVSAGAVINIEPMIKDGSLYSLEKINEGPPSIILGEELARQLGVLPGDIINVISPQGRLTPLGRSPNSRKYRVTGLFNSGMYEYDSSLIYTSITEAQDFLGIEGGVTGIEVRVNEAYKSDLIGESIQKKLGYPFWTKDWKVMNKSLLSALQLEKITMFVILTMIILVGALNIISTLVMIVMEKTRDVAILRAMGATSGSIMKIFMFQGLLVGITGTLAGLVSGLGICHLISRYLHIEMPTDFYGIATLPVRVEATDVIVVTLAAVFISFLATIYPSWHASRLNPVEALRYE
ncbi:MAG: lipoprotein-releasing ABC transporter permease subunit [Deltaproteobacteria bacterium]|nr:lipoprotein-releasing ABC transporter permease subunit [Deltaproteobacteria bacterium]